MDSQPDGTDRHTTADSPDGSSAGAASRLGGGTPVWQLRSLRRAVAAGVTAFVVGYLLTAVAFLVEMRALSLGGDSGSGNLVSTIIDQAVGVGGRQVVASSGGELALALRSVGWTFFSAQGVPLSGTAAGLGVSASGTVDVLTLAGKAVEIPLTPPLYYLIPPLCLAATGWWLASAGPVSSMREGAVTGGLVLAGYLPCVLVATLLLAFSATVNLVVASGTITARPVLWRALVFGTGYAVVFGGLGGVVAAKIRAS